MVGKKKYGAVESRIAQGHVVANRKAQEARYLKKRRASMLQEDNTNVVLQNDDGKSMIETLPTEVVDVLAGLLQTLDARKTLHGHAIDVNDMTSVFAAFDKDGGGTLDSYEFEAGLKRLGFTMTVSQLRSVYQIIDNDNSGQIQYSEFVSLLEAVKKELEQINSRKSEFRGVTAAARKSNRKWQVHFVMPKHLQFGLVAPRPEFLGHFDDEILAARAYDRVCIDRLGHIDA